MTSALDRARARWGYASARAGNGETPSPPTSRLRDCGPGQDLNAMVTATGAIPAGSSCVSSLLLQTPRWPRPGEPGYKRPNPAADAQAFLKAAMDEDDNRFGPGPVAS